MEITESDHTTDMPKNLPDGFFIGDDDYDAIVSGPTEPSKSGSEKRSAKMPYPRAGQDLQDRIEAVIDEFNIPGTVRTMIREKLSQAIATELESATGDNPSY